MKRSYRPLALIFLCLALCASLATAQAQDKWTFMVYMDGDCNLEDAAIDDFLEMAAVGSTNDVNILVLMDRTPGYDDRYGDWTDARRGRIASGDTPTATWGESVGEVNMGSPDTLVGLVTWGIQNYPADNYAVILWDHGGGWRAQADKDAVKAVCWDDTSGGDCLYTKEVGSAFSSAYSTTNVGLGIVGFDACLMGMIEVGYQVKDYASVMVASQDNEPWDGWPYTSIMTDLVATPTMTPAQLGTVIVNRYYESYSNSETLSATDLTQFDSLASDVSALASALKDQALSAPKACFDAATQVMTRLDSVVIHEMHGSAWTVGGLATYFPDGQSAFSSDYNSSNISYAGATQWDEFLSAYYSALTGSWVATARDETFEIPGDTSNIDLEDFCTQVCKYAPTGLFADPLEGIFFSGAAGGPWSPSQQSFTLTNYEQTALSWTASPTQPWITVSPASGSLDPGASAQVAVSINDLANALGGGQYAASLEFNSSGASLIDPVVRSVTLNVAGQPANAFYWFPLDTDPGWTRNGTWEFGTPTGANDPSSGYTGSNVFGNTLSGNYPNDVSGDYLVTSALDCSGRQNVTLSFWRWLGVEGYYDSATVEVSNDGSNWTTLWSNPGSDTEESEWTLCEYDISSVADNQSTVYIRWALISDFSVTFAGWNIDDIALVSDVCGISSGQTLDITSTGHFYAFAWSYASGSSLASVDTTGAGQLGFIIPDSGWVGAYLYDYDTAGYVEGFYTCSEQLN